MRVPLLPLPWVHCARCLVVPGASLNIGGGTLSSQLPEHPLSFVELRKRPRGQNGCCFIKYIIHDGC